MRRCYIVIRNSKGLRRCGRRAGPDGACERHQHVHDLMHKMNQDALDALRDRRSDAS